MSLVDSNRFDVKQMEKVGQQGVAENIKKKEHRSMMIQYSLHIGPGKVDFLSTFHIYVEWAIIKATPNETLVSRPPTALPGRACPFCVLLPF